MNALVAAITPPADARAEWQAAFARFDAARTEWQVFRRETYDPACAAEDAIPLAIGQRCDDLCNAYTDAAFDMIKVPSPDVLALSAKLHWLFEDLEPGGYSDSYSAATMFQILADARALAGAAA